MSESTTYPTPVEAAKAYQETGLQCVPVLADGSKRPAGKWKQYQDPTKKSPLPLFLDKGVAIVCGAASGGLEVIDFDQPGLFAPWCDLVEQQCPGLIQRLVIVQTPRADDNGEHGRHVYYRCFLPDGNTILASDPGEKPGEKVTTIETRGQGGYVLAVGSPGACHPTGGTYEMIAGELDDLPDVTEHERSVMFECARALSRWVEAADVGEKGPEATVYVDDTLGKSPGDRFEAVTSWGDILGAHGYQLFRQDCWTRPGKESGTSATTCCRSKAGRSLLKIHSTNDPFFEHGKTYSKFGAHAYLNHGGDFSAAAKDLAARGFGGAKASSMDSTGDEAEQRVIVLPQIERAADMPGNHPSLAEPIIHDLLRRGETCNMISVPKLRKSYSMLSLCVSLASGRPWMGIDGFPVRKSKVLLLDNELHRETLASRLTAVVKAQGIRESEYRDRFDVDCLRGRLTDLYAIGEYFEAVAEHEYEVIVMDSLYRFWPADMSENDNGAVTQIYNQIDRLAAKLNCAFVLVHHASKGQQTGKAVTDVGSGAGAISRAADTHIALRPHEKDDHVVMDVVTRSFPPMESLTLEWEYPLWKRSNETPVLKSMPTAKDKKQDGEDSKAISKLVEILSAADGPMTRNRIRREMGVGTPRNDRIIRLALDEERIQKVAIDVRGKEEDGFQVNGCEKEDSDF